MNSTAGTAPSSAGPRGFPPTLRTLLYSVLAFQAGSEPARVLLYAGEPQNIRLAARGPFIAGSEAELAQYFAEFRRGAFPRASTMRARLG